MIDNPTKDNSGRGNFADPEMTWGRSQNWEDDPVHGVKWERGGIRQGKPDQYASTPTLF